MVLILTKVRNHDEYVENDEDSENNEEVEDEGTVLEIGQASTFGVSFVSISYLSIIVPFTFATLSFSEPRLISFRFTTYMHPFRSCTSDV